MKLLLDTHILIWAAKDLPRLSAAARAIMLAPENERFFSVCSIWEIAIKTALGRQAVVSDATDFRDLMLANGYQELPILASHVLYTSKLPAIHKDPFDRLLVAQSLVERLTLITSDATVASYSAAVVRV
jgi:PIN domain nuclease of toxin-antitoxin system